MFTATVFSEECGFLALSQRADMLDGTEPQGTRQTRARNRLISARPTCCLLGRARLSMNLVSGRPIRRDAFVQICSHYQKRSRDLSTAGDREQFLH